MADTKTQKSATEETKTTANGTTVKTTTKSVVTTTIDPTMFAGDQIQKELEGEMVRRVSRATIVKALKAQTATISALFKVLSIIILAE